MIYLNDCRWSLLDKLSQGAANVSAPLGTLSEYIHLIPPALASGYLMSLSSNPIIRVACMITSAVTIALVNRTNDALKKNWVKEQIKKICVNSGGNRKLVYIASSYSDPSGLFPGFFFDFRTKSDITRLAQNFDVIFTEATSESQLKQEIFELKDGDVDAAIIQAHGCHSAIQFSRDYRVELNSLGIFETLATKLKPNSNVTLISCLTGGGEENISKEISILCSGSTIFSPKEIYTIGDYDSFKISEDGSCSFKNGNFITGLFEERKSITRIYQNGVNKEE